MRNKHYYKSRELNQKSNQQIGWSSCAMVNFLFYNYFGLFSYFNINIVSKIIPLHKILKSHLRFTADSHKLYLPFFHKKKCESKLIRYKIGNLIQYIIQRKKRGSK